jgi:hypothetical protein
VTGRLFTLTAEADFAATFIASKGLRPHGANPNEGRRRRSLEFKLSLIDNNC